MALPSLPTSNPTAAYTNAPKRAFARTLKLFHEAALRIPAYKDFLKKANIKPELIRTPAEFAQVPITDKVNYISAYPLPALSWDGVLPASGIVSSSSGSTGKPFFWPRSHAEDRISGLMHQRIYENIFDARNKTTLFVNSFALGMWMAGVEFFNAAQWVGTHGARVTIVNPGIDKQEVLNQIRNLAAHYDQLLFGGYPPFLKDIIEEGSATGIDWKNMEVKLFYAGESASEAWRARMSELLGSSNPNFAINLYGMAEAGTLGHETPVTLHLRQSDPLGKRLVPLASDAITGLYQYYPTLRFFETVEDETLVVTARTGIPLIRYNTRDRGGLIPFETLQERKEELFPGSRVSITSSWQLPLVYLYGRKDFAVSFYALLIYVEHLKYAFEHARSAHELSGLFTVSVEHSSSFDQEFKLIVELAPGVTPSDSLATELTEDVIKNLSEVNKEYKKLYSAMGERAKPLLTLVPHGGIQTIPGRKHKWVKRG